MNERPAPGSPRTPLSSCDRRAMWLTLVNICHCMGFLKIGFDKEKMGT